jgi:hypothetical protein
MIKAGVVKAGVTPAEDVAGRKCAFVTKDGVPVSTLVGQTKSERDLEVPLETDKRDSR